MRKSDNWRVSDFTGLGQIPQSGTACVNSTDCPSGYLCQGPPGVKSCVLAPPPPPGPVTGPPAKPCPPAKCVARSDGRELSSGCCAGGRGGFVTPGGPGGPKPACPPAYPLRETVVITPPATTGGGPSMMHYVTKCRPGYVVKYPEYPDVPPAGYAGMGISSDGSIGPGGGLPGGRGGRCYTCVPEKARNGSPNQSF